ncbi:1-acyl-sn-glycerol-3-phosphate acyltransferase [Robertkochia marina]|uniref:1-acyl-sn-glycerol-3-phosphate acyltransferase n=1 Tax=Robertkochia marina TaxID=1227945 RepID=A0A4S3M1V5_9FLAO|nr:1-acyl-sn-glycerol-3-phosphate acyltransferase [Robertkochia marina]THD69036.1 1-acyl-sn-glycerol-3-phosphate acyltransferase [Robertkochia marina]TRZ44859.1 1-acyl-sn-glycerol-3-phosphate acyltransferase [Robertkochia marina]
MTTIDTIRPYYDEEVNAALKEYARHPMIGALLQFTFPDKSVSEINAILDNCHSIRDFQSKVVYHSIQQVLERSSEGFTTEGFEQLDPDTSYLFISNHRDIILDTSLLNVALYDHGLIMTASAIGDNLVKKSFLLALSKLNRNFLIRRGLSAREMLQSSRLVSDYIRRLIIEENRSVWIAQREGRTKDGDDRTQQGVLKMIAMAREKQELIPYMKKLKIVPVSISYEFDPTDVLKMPELMAKHYDQEYVKSGNEDFNSILKGVTGQKKRIHIAASAPLDDALDQIAACGESGNRQFQLLTELIDAEILKTYKLWPSNYIAWDLLNKSDRFKEQYTDKEKRQFERRITRRICEDDPVEVENFLKMYANPVINKLSS